MFSRAVERALAIAIGAHDGQVRRGDAHAPYVVHPLHVAIMLARWGMDEDVLVAGILHDVVEDSKEWTLERIEGEFGAHIASVVGELTEDKGQAWVVRKQTGIEKVARMSSQAATVKAVDKLHNLHSIVLDLRACTDAEAVWGRFRGGREGTLRVAREFVGALTKRVDPRLGRALAQALQSVLDEDLRTTPAPV